MNLKVIIFVISLRCSLLLAMDIPRDNYIKVLPPEMQNYILSFLPPLNDRKKIEKRFETLRQGEMFHPIETNVWKIYDVKAINKSRFEVFLDDTHHDLVICNKITGNRKTLIQFNDQPYASVILKRIFQTFTQPTKDFLAGSTKRISPYAVSPNFKKLVGIQTETCIAKADKQTGIWLVDLETNKKEFKPMPELFVNRSVEISQSQESEYIQKGYEVNTFFHYANKLFNHTAVANDGTFALSDRDTIYCIDPVTDTVEIKFEYRKNTREPYNNIKALLLGPNKTLAIKHDLTTKRHSDGKDYLENLTIIENDVSLPDYFERMGICKKKQLIDN